MTLIVTLTFIIVISFIVVVIKKKGSQICVKGMSISDFIMTTIATFMMDDSESLVIKPQE